MTIKLNAFNNCSSLKEIHCEVFDDIIDFKSRFNDGISDNYIVIVKDKLYKKWLNANFEVHIVKASNYIQSKIDNLNNSKVLKTILLLNDAKHILSNKDFLAALASIEKMLLKKYNIQQNDIEKIKALTLRKKKYELE